MILNSEPRSLSSSPLTPKPQIFDLVGPPWAVDAWGLGCLIQEVQPKPTTLNPCTLNPRPYTPNLESQALNHEA